MSRPGIIGSHIDHADRRELNRIGKLDFVNLPRKWWEWNEHYRARLWTVLIQRFKGHA